MKIVAADIGGTNARFAIAEIADGMRPILHAIRSYPTADHAGLISAWRRFREEEGGTLPAHAAIAVAAPVDRGTIEFPNSSWLIEPDGLDERLNLEKLVILNDFGAVAHAVAWLDPSEFVHIAGPKERPAEGVTTVMGPGTGLGVAQLLRRHGRYHIIETEGGHTDFAPLDAVEQQILDRLRSRYRRVSTERIASGPGLANLYEALAVIERQSIRPRGDAELWQAALDGSDPVARSAMDRFVMSLGSIAGDLALAHGANQIVLTGSLANRLADRLHTPLFHERFRAKGRYAERMGHFPVSLATFRETGLLGAAAAFSQGHS